MGNHLKCRGLTRTGKALHPITGCIYALLALISGYAQHERLIHSVQIRKGTY
jgi:hypothetical protein